MTRKVKMCLSRQASVFALQFLPGFKEYRIQQRRLIDSLKNSGQLEVMIKVFFVGSEGHKGCMVKSSLEGHEKFAYICLLIALDSKCFYCKIFPEDR